MKWLNSEDKNRDNRPDNAMEPFRKKVASEL